MTGATAVPIGSSSLPLDLTELIKYFRDNRDSILKLQQILPVPDRRTDMTLLIEQCAGEGFSLRLIELSILDPDDPETTIALVLVPATKGQELALAYRDQMRLNLSPQERRDTSRGPIVPHPALYASVAWRMVLNEVSRTGAAPSSAQPTLEGWMTSYDSGQHRADHQVQASIEAFAGKFFGAATKAMPSLADEMTEVIVVPFPAPAQGRRAPDAAALRGGGGAVFLWGRWATDSGTVGEQDVLRLAERILQTMTRTVLAYSRLASEELEHVRDVLLRTKHALFNPAVVAEGLLNRVAQSWGSAAGLEAARPDFETARSTVGALRRFCNVIDLLYRRSRVPGPLKKGTAEWPPLVSTAVGMLPRPDGSRLRVADEVVGEPREVIGNCDGWELVFWLLIKNAAEAAERVVTDSALPFVTVQLSYDEPDPGALRTPRAHLHISNPCGHIDERRLFEMQEAFMGRANRITPDGSKPASMGLGLATVGQMLNELGVGAQRRLWADANTFHVEIQVGIADA